MWHPASELPKLWSSYDNWFASLLLEDDKEPEIAESCNNCNDDLGEMCYCEYCEDLTCTKCISKVHDITCCNDPVRELCPHCAEDQRRENKEYYKKG